MRDYLVFAVAPYLAAFAFVPICAVRYLLWRARPHRDTPVRPAHGSAGLAATAGQVALVVVALGHLLAFAFPDYLLQWNRQIGRLIALEAFGAIAAIVAIVGLTVSGIRAVRTGHRDAEAPLDIVARSLVLTAMLSGLAIAAMYRWASVWSAVTLLPYLHSLAGLDPRISLVTYLPPLVKLHVASAFAILAILPFTETARLVMVEIDGLARRTLAPLGAIVAARRSGTAAGITVSVDALRTRVLRNNAEEN